MVISRALVQEMFDHALRERPNEACGILAAEDGMPVKFYPAKNAERSPTRYSVEPADQLRIMRDIDDRGWELQAIFHSHTHTQAYPSSTDVNLAQPWPEQIYLIASLQHEQPELKAYRIVDSKVSEEPLDIRQ